jgi:hypothetical protein
MADKPALTVHAMAEFPVSAKFEKYLLIAEWFVPMRRLMQANGRIVHEEAFAGNPRLRKDRGSIVLDKLEKSIIQRNLSSMLRVNNRERKSCL